MIRYWSRRFVLFVRSPGVVCRAKGCAENQVGYSRFCRKHTDWIFARERDAPRPDWFPENGVWDVKF